MSCSCLAVHFGSGNIADLRNKVREVFPKSIKMVDETNVASIKNGRCDCSGKVLEIGVAPGPTKFELHRCLFGSFWHNLADSGRIQT